MKTYNVVGETGECGESRECWYELFSCGHNHRTLESAQACLAAYGEIHESEGYPMGVKDVLIHDNEHRRVDDGDIDWDNVKTHYGYHNEETINYKLFYEPTKTSHRSVDSHCF